MDNQQGKCVLDKMSYCVGVMLGDGHCAMNSDGYPTVKLEMIDLEVVEIFAAAVNSQFNLGSNVKTHEHVDKATTHIWVSRQKPVFEFFRDITAHKQFFPEWYFTAQRSEQMSLLAGLWDTDGFIAKSNVKAQNGKVYEQRRAGFSNTSERLVRDTARLLTLLRVRVARVESLEVQGNRRPQWRILPNFQDFVALGLPMQCKRKLERMSLREQ